MRNRYFYYVPDCGDIKDMSEIKDTAFEDIRSLVCEAAEQYLRDTGGELADPDCWPVTIVIVTEAGDEVGRADADLEYEPSFTARNATGQGVDS